MPPGLYVGLSSGNVGIGTTGIAGSSNAFNLTTTGASGAITVLANGNVGIGTANPQAKLHINGYITQIPAFIDVVWYNASGDSTIQTNPTNGMNLNFTTIDTEVGAWTKSASVTGNGGWSYVSGATVSTTTASYAAFAPPVSGYYLITFNLHGFDQNFWGDAYLIIGGSSINFTTAAPTGIGYSQRNISGSAIRYLTPSTYVALNVGPGGKRIFIGSTGSGWSPRLTILKVA